MFLYITLILTLIANPVHPSPSSDQMLHCWVWNYSHPKIATGEQINSNTYTNDTCIRSFKNR